jgi:hypothetical protein
MVILNLNSEYALALGSPYFDSPSFSSIRDHLNIFFLDFKGASLAIKINSAPIIKILFQYLNYEFCILIIL